MQIIVALLFTLGGFLGTAIGSPVAAVAAIDNALVENLPPRKLTSNNCSPSYRPRSHSVSES